MTSTERLIAGFHLLAAGAPPERRRDILAMGELLRDMLRELARGQAEQAEGLRLIRESIDPAVYESVRLLGLGLSLELAEAYARLDEVEGKAVISDGERASLRAGLVAAAQDRADLQTMIGALTQDLAILRDHVERCCGPGGPRARVVGAPEERP